MCVDLWTKDGALPASAVVRPHVALPAGARDAQRVIRGGHWHGTVDNVLCQLRVDYDPTLRTPRTGLRLVRSTGG